MDRYFVLTTTGRSSLSVPAPCSTFGCTLAPWSPTRSSWWRRCSRPSHCSSHLPSSDWSRLPAQREKTGMAHSKIKQQKHCSYLRYLLLCAEPSGGGEPQRWCPLCWSSHGKQLCSNILMPSVSLTLLLDAGGCPLENMTPCSHAPATTRPKWLFVTARSRDGGEVTSCQWRRARLRAASVTYICFRARKAQNESQPAGVIAKWRKIQKGNLYKK